MNIVFSICSYLEYCQILANRFNCNNVNPCYFPQRGPERRVVAPHFTHFPTAIGLAATWDPEAVREMANLLRRQMRSVGLLQALSPVMDVARDARCGRVHETYGEDPTWSAL